MIICGSRTPRPVPQPAPASDTRAGRAYCKRGGNCRSGVAGLQRFERDRDKCQPLVNGDGGMETPPGSLGLLHQRSLECRPRHRLTLLGPFEVWREAHSPSKPAPSNAAWVRLTAYVIFLWQAARAFKTNPKPAPCSFVSTTPTALISLLFLLHIFPLLACADPDHPFSTITTNLNPPCTELTPCALRALPPRNSCVTPHLHPRPPRAVASSERATLVSLFAQLLLTRQI